MDIRGFFTKSSKAALNKNDDSLISQKRKILDSSPPSSKKISKNIEVKKQSPSKESPIQKISENVVPKEKSKITKEISTSKPKRKLEEHNSSENVHKIKHSKAKDDKETHDGHVPFKNMTFVLTGEFSEFPNRDDLAMEILKFGGKTTQAVSSRTTYLVHGNILQDGRTPQEGSKYKKAVELNIKIIDENQMMTMLAEAGKERNTAKNKDEIAPVRKAVEPSGISTQLWVDKYKPKTINDLVGNTGAIKALSSWLQNWEAVHLHGAPKPAFNKQNPGAKAALLSGPPGIGKSSAAAIVARHHGYEVTEFNASDARSKNIVANVVGGAIGCKTLKNTSTKRLIIMDEVDGMSSEDRGGSQELIKLIKITKVPIICICNDRMKSNVRSLANHCFDLRFSKPQVQTIVARVLDIANREGMTVEPSAATILVQETQQDVRQILGTLQMWQRTSNKISFEDIQSRKKQMNKDESFFMNFFSASRYIFNERLKPDTFRLRNEFYFVDYDIIPLIIHEKYPDVVKSTKRDELEALKILSAASDAVCEADLAQNYVRSKMEWGLLPTVAALNVRAASIADGSMGMPEFPEWLGKNSTRSKNKRLLSETAMHMRQRVNVNANTMRLDYWSTLRNKLLEPLLANNKDGIEESVKLMSSYGLDRDDLFETMQELRIDSAPNPFDKIDSKIKAAFTREFNQHATMSQALAHEKGIKGLKTTKKPVRADADNLGGEKDENDDEVEEDEDDADTKKLLELGSKAGSKMRKASGGDSKSKSKSSAPSKAKKSKAK